MNILYCSTVCSRHTLEKISNKANYPLSSITIQKFHRLVLKGFVMNGATADTLSVPPSAGFLFNKNNDDKEDGISYHYLSTIEIPLIRHFLIIFGCLFQILLWKRKCTKDSFIVCDVLNVSLCISVILSKLFGVKVVGLMTDMPGLMVGDSMSFKGSIIKNINLFFLKKFDAYVFLTESMNNVINIKKRPYIIMEGLVDIDMTTSKHQELSNIRNIIYAGGVHERYGLVTLIKAFQKVKGDNYRLLIYGRLNGCITKDVIKKYEQADRRFHYGGVVPNKEIVNEELKAALLVNPRPTNEEFTKYSFPSKNMEYMVSGTPVLTMNLPGMPQEYHDKLFVCYDESVEGIAKEMSSILSLSDDELLQIGEIGKNFVLKHKNNKIQSKRILEIFKKIDVQNNN